jgi:hypothetical protein
MVHYKTVHFQNISPSQSGTVAKWHIVIKRYVLQKGSLQNGTIQDDMLEKVQLQTVQLQNGTQNGTQT